MCIGTETTLLLCTYDPSRLMEPEKEAVPDDLFEALADSGCREIIEALETPMTANEISEACDMPLSTTYRKVKLLQEATLVDEEVEVREDGKHTSRYVVDFEGVGVSLDDSHSLEVDVSRPETRDERLESLWREVQRET